MRLLPKTRGVRVALAVSATALAASWVWLYRPWEAHYRGRPSSWWSERLAETPFGLIPARPTRTPVEEWVNRALAPLGVRTGGNSSGLELGDGGAEAVPVLAELLRDPNPQVREWAASFLHDMEPPPKQTVPALLEAWQRYKADYRSDLDTGIHFATPRTAAESIHDALWRIDPDAARRAGVPDDGPPNDEDGNP